MSGRDADPVLIKRNEAVIAADIGPQRHDTVQTQEVRQDVEDQILSADNEAGLAAALLRQVEILILAERDGLRASITASIGFGFFDVVADIAFGEADLAPDLVEADSTVLDQSVYAALADMQPFGYVFDGQGVLFAHRGCSFNLVLFRSDSRK